MKTLRSLCLCALTMILTVGVVSAQDINVSGTVTDKTFGEPVIGAAVMIVGTDAGTITDIDGKFQITAPTGSQLQSSSVGMKTVVYDAAPQMDPNMFWNDEIGKWNLILACGQEMRIYTSDNLIEWTEESRFGKSYGNHEGVWECPDLFKLPVEGTDQQKWVLICNINPGGPNGGSATQYFIGDFDGKKFTVDNVDRYIDGKALWQDYGKDHYAAVSFSNAPDGRHTMIAWMSNWEYANVVPTMQYRSANTIAREPFLYQVNGEIFLGSRPSPEYDGAGLDQTVKVKGSCQILLANQAGEQFAINYDQQTMTLSCDRSQSGQIDFSPHFNEVATAPVHRKLSSIRIFIDNSSIEVFGNNGEVCLTSLVFPSSPLSELIVNKR